MVRGKEIQVTESDIDGNERRPNQRQPISREAYLEKLGKFIKTANQTEIDAINRYLEERKQELGIKPKPKTRDRVLTRLAVEAVPILLTLLIGVPLITFGVLWVMGWPYFQSYTYGCPVTCSVEALIIWAIVSGVGFLLIVLFYYLLRKAMMRARSF